MCLSCTHIFKKEETNFWGMSSLRILGEGTSQNRITMRDKKIGHQVFVFKKRREKLARVTPEPFMLSFSEKNNYPFLYPLFARIHKREKNNYFGVITKRILRGSPVVLPKVLRKS